MAWLTSQPVWALVVGCLAIALLIGFGSRALALAVIPSTEREESHAVAAALMTAFAAAFVLLTALTLANEATSLSSAQTIVSTEAADAANLAWASTNSGIDSGAVQAALGHYLEATRTYEWEGAASGNGDDPATDNAQASLQRVVRFQSARPTVASATSAELLTTLDALTTQRRLRLAAASRSLPGLYAVLVIVTGLALIVNTSLVGIHGRMRATVATASLVVVIALSVALLFALATPWRGAIKVSGQPIDAVITDLHTGYFHS